MHALAVGAGEEVEPRRALRRTRVAAIREHHPAEVEVPEQDGSRHDAGVFGLDAAGEAREHMPAAARDARERAHRDVAADEVAHDIDAATVCRVERDRGDVVRAVVRPRCRRRAPRQRSSLSALPAVAMTRAPSAAPSWTAAEPTPPAPAWTSSVWPARSCPRSTRARCATWNGKKKAAAWMSSSPAGASNVMSASASTTLGVRTERADGGRDHAPPEPRSGARRPPRPPRPRPPCPSVYGQRRVDGSIAAEAAVDLVEVERCRHRPDDDLTGPATGSSISSISSASGGSPYRCTRHARMVSRAPAS